MRRSPALSVLAVIIVVNILIYILGVAVPDMNQDWMLVSDSSLVGNLLGLATYSFVHSGFFHLFFNMLILLWAGRILLFRAGWLSFLIIYFAGGLLGGLGFLAVSAASGVTSLSLCGASAAVLGVVGGLWPDYHNKYLSLKKFFQYFGAKNNKKIVITFKGRYVLAGILLIVVVTNSTPAAIVTHCCGFTGGIITSYLLQKRRVYRLNRLQPQLNVGESVVAASCDAIFEKIRLSGYDSLTSEERQQLKNMRP